MATIIDLQEAIAGILASDLTAYIRSICQDFDLSPPKYSPDGLEKSYSARVAYVLSIIADKDESFCRNLANRVLGKYPSNQLKALINLPLEPLPNKITTTTRLQLIEEFSDQNMGVFGRCEPIEFLKRIWPIETMPAIDSRHETAVGDIETHFLQFKDWNLRYLLKNYFRFLTLPDDVVIHFIEQTVHPDVRKLSEQNSFALLINQYLNHDGLQLSLESGKQSFPTYSVQPLDKSNELSLGFEKQKPELAHINNIEDLLRQIINGIPKAMRPLRDRHKGHPALTFDNEYDVQTLFHALLHPWVIDIRAEELTPSYAGSSARIDFVLPAYGIVLEFKYVRDKTHAKMVGKELTIDIAYYQKHPNCTQLWAVIYDPHKLIDNPGGLKSDIEGEYRRNSQTLRVYLHIL